MKNPKVSIIIPYKEDRGFLQEAINSIANQSYNNIELILSNNDANKSFNFNRGIEKATGSLIKYLDDDDMLPPDAIANSVNCMVKNKGLAMHGNAIIFFNTPEEKTPQVFIPIQKTPTLERMLFNNVMHGTTLMYHKSVFDKFGLFNEDLWTAEEYEFNLRLLSKKIQFHYCNKYIAYYRRHINQKSIGNTNEDYQQKRQRVIKQIKNLYTNV